MNETPYHRLESSSIVRKPNDNGTLFAGDALFTSAADLRNFSGDGHTCNVSKVVQTSSSHAGTHADKPAHFHSSPAFDQFDPYIYQGKSAIIDVSGRLQRESFITQIMIEDALADLVSVQKYFFERVLIRTNPDSEYPFVPIARFPHLSKQAAEFLAAERKRHGSRMDHESSSHRTVCHDRHRYSFSRSSR